MRNQPVSVTGAEKEARFSRFFQFLPDAVFVARADDSVILEINDAFTTLTGYGADSIVGRPAMGMVFFLAPDLWTRVRLGIEAAGEVLDLETRLLRKDGRIAFVRISMRRLEVDGISCHLATIHDISGRRKVEEQARCRIDAPISGLESLLHPDADIDHEEVGRLIDFQALQDLMNSLYKTTRIPMAITDVTGNVQIATGWQDICTRFHRIHPETLANCKESDIHLSRSTNEGEHALYKCKNGVWDMATPIIIGGRHIANLFLGQFLFDDEVPDYDFFKKQADRYGFDVEEYLAALDRVPRWSREAIENAMEFHAKLAMLISRLSIGNIRVAHALAEQRRISEELRQANLIVENSTTVLFRRKTSAGWPVEFVSENVTQFGYTPEMFMSGKISYSAMIHPDDLEKVVSEVEGYSSRGVDRFQLEYRIVTGEGAVRWVEERTAGERDEKGSLVCYQGVVIDITDRKQAERELLLAKFCVDNAGIAIYHTFKHDIFNANDHACRSLGYTVDELRTMRVSDIDPAITDEQMREIEKSLERTGSATHQTVHRRKDGTTYPVEITASTMEFQGMRYTFSFVQDISERKRAEDALRESEEKFRVLAETATAAIALHQGDRFIYVNPATSRISGYSEAELLEMNFWDWSHEDCRQTVQDRGLARLRGEPAPLQYEHKFVTKSGEVRWGVISAGKIEYRGKPAVIATLLDIHEAKRAEERMQAALAEKTVLLKEVHHRVKNNLQIISSLLYLQSEYIQDPQSRIIFRESQNRISAMALVHQKLYQSESLAFIDFREYIEELVNHLNAGTVNDQGLICLTVDAAEVSLGVDEAIPCGLIVNELVSNSIKHAFPDGGEGEITVRCRVEDDGWVTLTVTDSGVGMPAGLDFRNTETLGLQLVNMLVKQLRGRIAIDSERVGTAVMITFPGCPAP
jgi:PAS domain S-box-containing protein